MNRIYTLLIFCLLTNLSIQGQNCDIPNGSFEDWIDVTLEIDNSGTLEAESIFLPANFGPAFRLLLATFSQVFGSITDQNIAEKYFGLERSTDASDGQYALKINGNEFLSISDALTAFPCDTDLPTFLSVDVKHVGNSEDTLFIGVTAGDEVRVPVDDDAFDDSRGYIAEELVFSEDSDYKTINIPFIDNENGTDPDSIVIWIIVAGNEESIGNEEGGHFLIDNMQFNQMVNTSTPELTEDVNIYPMPFINKVQVENNNPNLTGEIYNLNGQHVKSINVPKGGSTFDLQDIGAQGHYILKLTDNENGQMSSYPLIKG